MSVLFNRFLAVTFVTKGRTIGGRQLLQANRVVHPPSIEIDIKHTAETDPNEAKITIYNMAPTTQQELLSEGDKIEVTAGYWPYASQFDPNGVKYVGVIYKGQIRKCRTRMEGGIEVITEIECGDGDDAIGHTQHRKKHAKGSTTKDIATDIAKDMSERGIEVGRIDMPETVISRAKTIDRRGSRELDDICLIDDLQWSIQDGVLNIYPRDTPLRETGWVLEPESGVLDSPEFTEDGVELRTLMYPDMRPGVTFTLRNKNVRERATGTYMAHEVTFSGSNYGGEFGCRIVAKEVINGKVKRSRERLPKDRT